MMSQRRRLIPSLLIAFAAGVLPGCAGLPNSGTTTPRVLIVGGGASHDFDQWFHKADSATLAQTGAQVRYTSTPSDVLPALTNTDVLYMTANQALPDAAMRQKVFDLVRAGRGLIVGHAGAWYNWRDWPEWNRDLVGGGTRGHRRYGDFEVNVVAPEHPILQGVPRTFTIRDELYRFTPDTAGASIQVLATAREVETGTVYPIIWTVSNPNGRIVVNTLGHDGEAHNHPAYRTILQNSLRWVSGQR